jgi:hypothetical protein
MCVELDRDTRRDDEQAREDIRVLFERYRAAARHAAEPALHDDVADAPAPETETEPAFASR